jgi:hypothetical protein
MSDKLHARLSPSSSGRWLNCSYSAQKDLPELTNAAAVEGNEAHDWAAEVVMKRVRLDQVPSHLQDGIGRYAAHIFENGGTPYCEQMWESFAIDDFFGTIDCLLINDDKAAIYDYKTGKWPVDAEGNTQLLCYAAIVAEHFNIDEFFGVIVQPNAFRGSKIKTAEFTPREVERHRKRVARAAVSDEKKVGDWCRFCPLRLTDQCYEGLQHGVIRGW